MFFSSGICVSLVPLGMERGEVAGLLTRGENIRRPHRRVQERLCANLVPTPRHLDGELLVLVGCQGGLQMVDSEELGGWQGRRVEALELARAARIVALGEDGLEEAVADIRDDDVDDAEEGEGEGHCGGWRGGGDGWWVSIRGRAWEAWKLIYTPIYIGRITSTEEQRNFQSRG